MVGLTLAISAAASVLVFFLTPVYGLAVYIAVLGWYPSYLTVKLGTIDFNVCRIVILAIYARLFLLTNLTNRFKFIWLDKLIILYFLCQVLAGAVTAQSLMAFLENRAGAVFSLVLPYFAVRLIVTNREEYVKLLKTIVLVAAPMAIIGFYESMTGNNPVGFLRNYWAWGGSAPYVAVSRFGFFRAELTFPHAIMYGLFFAMFGPLCAGALFSAKTDRAFYSIGLGLMGIGVFSSMSSGPWLAGLLSISFIVFFRWRKHWKPVVLTILLVCFSVEIISNRHFYDVLGDFTMNPSTAWYRSKLIDVALFEGGMSDHWLTGFGFGVDPGWGVKIDGRERTDTVNHYIFILHTYGLVGFVPFLAMNAVVVKKLVDAYRASFSASDKWLVWCLSAALFGLSGALTSVSLFGQPSTIYYMIIGFAGVMPGILSGRNDRRGWVSSSVSVSEISVPQKP